MDNFFVHRVSRLTVALCVALSLVGGAASASGAEPKLDDDWHFILILPLWLPSVNGKMKISVPDIPQITNSVSNEFNMGHSNYLDNINFALLLTMEVEKGRWSLLSDIMYVDFSDDNREVTFPNLAGGNLAVKADTKFQAFLFEGGPAYSLYRSERIKFDFLAGLRYMHLDSEATVNVSTPLPVTFPSHKITVKDDLVDPIVGIKGRFELGKGWFIPYYFDGGGFGINNEWSWQAFGALGYHFGDLFSMMLGYRHLQYNFDHSELLQDVYLSGAELGFIFRF